MIPCYEGYDVTSVGISQNIIGTIKKECHAYNRTRLVCIGTISCKLTFSTPPLATGVFIVAAPTPYDNDRKHSYVESVTLAIAPLIQPCNLVTLESTSPVGTINRIAKLLSEAGHYITEKTDITHYPEKVSPIITLVERVRNGR